MAWGSKSQIITAASVTDTESFSSAVTLNPGESAVVEVEADFPSSPTDYLIASIYSTLDDTSENWDDTPILSWPLINTLDPNKAAVVINDLYKFRIGVKASGSTDTITVDAWYRKNGISL